MSQPQATRFQKINTISVRLFLTACSESLNLVTPVCWKKKKNLNLPFPLCYSIVIPPGTLYVILTLGDLALLQPDIKGQP